MDSGAAGGGHVVGVAGPAGDDVDMEMGGDAGTGGGSEIEADVVAVGLEGFFEEGDGAVDGGPEVGRLGLGEVGKFGHFAGGEDHEVAEVVGIAVEEDETGFGTEDDEMGLIVAGGGDLREEVAGIGTGFANIGVAPRGPKMFHEVSRVMAENESKLKSSHILITGSDEFLVRERAGAVLRAVAPEDPMNLETVDGYVDNSEAARQRLASVLEALQTLPFFGGRKVVYLKDASFLGDGPAAKSEEVGRLLEQLAADLEKLPPSSVQLVISSPSVDKRRAFFKNFSKNGVVETFDQVDLRRERDMDAWLDEVERRLRAAGLNPGAHVVERLVELVGSDSMALHMEIEKLKLFAHPHGNVDEESVRTIGSSNREMLVWDLCDAITLGRPGEAVRILRTLMAQGESEVGILILLGGHIRLAALGTHLKETGRLRVSKRGSFVSVEFAPEADDLLPRNKKGDKPNAFRLAKILQQSGQKKSGRWFKALEILHQTHGQLFSGGGGDRSQVLEAAVIQVCTV